eukprot:scaffold71726_cov42-Phaeocystis_antarctica.AAC.4
MPNVVKLAHRRRLARAPEAVAGDTSGRVSPCACRAAQSRQAPPRGGTGAALGHLPGHLPRGHLDRAAVPVAIARKRRT